MAADRFDWKKNPWARIEGVEGEEIICQRLLESGFIRGALVSFVSRAPFNGPTVVNVMGSVFALRTEEINCLRCKPVDVTEQIHVEEKE